MNSKSEGTIFAKATLSDSLLPVKIREYLMTWASRRKPSLYIKGVYGCGKTHAIHALVNEIYKLTGPPYFYHFFLESVELENDLRNAILAGKESFLMEKWSEAPLLIIDDLGREIATERVQQQYYRLINARYKYNFSTVVTSNLDPSELKLDEATISRLQSYNILNFPPIDRRESFKKNC